MRNIDRKIFNLGKTLAKKDGITIGEALRKEIPEAYLSLMDNIEDTDDRPDPIECRRCHYEGMSHRKGTNEWICPECGNTMTIEDGNYCFMYGDDDDYDIYYSDDYPEECKACGNGAYPDCMSGCEILED